MKKAVRRALCALLCAVLIASAPGGASACAADAAPAAERAARERPRLEDIRLYVCGLLRGRAYMKGETPYISLADIGEIYGIDIAVDVQETSFTASAPGLELVGEAESGYLRANYRYIYLPQGYLACGGDVYLPLDAVSRIFTLTGEVKNGRLELSTAEVRMIRGSEDYYETHFSADELYWLPHIAYVEALDQPLAGIMGVVTVVLNRVESEDFPNTIFEVLYDSKHTVQFTPAATGSMHGRPTELYYIAAYLVLEGYNTVGDSLYFVNPANNGNYWFRENLTHVASIGDHEFYR